MTPKSKELNKTMRDFLSIIREEEEKITDENTIHLIKRLRYLEDRKNSTLKAGNYAEGWARDCDRSISKLCDVMPRAWVQAQIKYNLIDATHNKDDDGNYISYED